MKTTNFVNMKLFNLLSDNKNVSFVSLYSIVPLCKNVTAKIETLTQTNKPFFVFVSEKDTEILEVKEKSILLGKIVGGRVQRSKTVLYFHDNNFRIVSRENWKETWKHITPSEKEKNDKIRIEKKEKTAFDECLPDRGYKKPSKRGFMRTISANTSMERISLLGATSSY